MENHRTENIQVRVNPIILRQFEELIERQNMSLEDAFNNFMESKCNGNHLENDNEEDDTCPYCSDEFWERVYYTKDTQEAIAEMEAWEKDPNRKGYQTIEELWAALEEDDDDDGED